MTKSMCRPVEFIVDVVNSCDRSAAVFPKVSRYEVICEHGLYCVTSLVWHVLFGAFVSSLLRLVTLLKHVYDILGLKWAALFPTERLRPFMTTDYRFI